MAIGLADQDPGELPLALGDVVDVVGGIEQAREWKPERFLHFVVDAQLTGSASVIHECGDHELGLGARVAPLVVEPSQQLGIVEGEAHLLERLSLCGLLAVGISGVDASAGKRHVAGPGIALVPSALDEEHLGTPISFCEDHGDGGVAHVIHRMQLGAMHREGASDTFDGDQDRSIAATAAATVTPMDRALATQPAARRLLDLARRDRAAAEEAVAKLPLEEQLALVCEAPLEKRDRVLGLLPEPAAVIPLMPPAELCFTVKAIGLADAAWLLDYATPEQTVAAIDLDAWHGNELDRATANQWLEAFARTSQDAQLRALESLDAETLMLALRERIGVEQRPDEHEGWSPPDGAQTLEGQFHYWALRDDDDLADVTTLLRTLFERAYWSYFRLMHAVRWELSSDSEEWALRWRTGRLEDLGFPAWDDAMRIYRFLDPEQRRELPPEARPFEIGAWQLPVWMPQLPEVSGPGDRIFRAMGALPDEARRASFYAFIALANRVAVADRLPLGEAESTPDAIAKAGRVASLGLAHLAEEHGLSDSDVLARVSLEHLFRVGANLDPEGARPGA